jgi:hypothetical protein
MVVFFVTSLNLPEEDMWSLPKTIGACADALYKIRQDRLTVQKKIDELKGREEQLREYLIATLPKSDATGAAGKVARAQIKDKRVPKVEDWDALYKHVKRTGSFELLQRRVSDEAVKERWDAGKQVPGVEVFTTVTVSVTKL